MKITNYLILLFAIVIASCTSNEGIGTAVDENLPEIAEKLKALETSALETEEDQSSFKSINKKRKALAKNLEECKYEAIEEYSNGDETTKTTYKYFDHTGRAITDCDLWDFDETSFKYAVDFTQITTGVDYMIKLHQYISYERSLKLLSASSAEFYQSIKSDVDGTLNFDDEIFNILDGSYMNLEMSFQFSENSDPDYLLENTDPEIDVKYIIGFEVNANDYHFEMTLDTEGMKAIENSDLSNFRTEYILLNSQNQKIGTVVYSNFQEKENFEVLDLDGNIVTVD